MGLKKRVSRFFKSLTRIAPDEVETTSREQTVQGESGPLPPDVLTPEELGRALFNRLNKSVREDQDPDVRHLMIEEIRGDMLSNHLISLMFSLRTEEGSLISDHWIDKVLEETSDLEMHRSVFYFYIDERAPITLQWETVKTSLYKKLVEYARRHACVTQFLESYFGFRWRRANITDSFDPTNPSHQDLVPNALPLHVNVCRKRFPATGRFDVFIVGRKPAHDMTEIERYEEQRLARQRRAAVFGRNDSEDTVVRLAVSVRSKGSRNGKYVLFNAHRFSPDSPGTRTERSLFLGNWRSEWQLSIGAAEHDEIRCIALGEYTDKLTLHNLRKESGAWTFELQEPLRLPSWFKCKRGIDIAEEGVTVWMKSPGALQVALRGYLNRAEHIPKIMLSGRVLPKERGQKDELVSSADQRLSQQLARLEIRSAIEVQLGKFWLVRTGEDKMIRITKEADNVWQSAAVENKQRFSVNQFSYVWTKAEGGELPQDYYGQLLITPPDNLKVNFEQELAASPDADELPLGRDNVFTSISNDVDHRDNFLGESGIVSVKCLDLKGGKPIYGLIPVSGARNAYFAFRPPVRPAGHQTGWLIYDSPDKQPRRDLEPGPNGWVRYGGADLVLDDANNTLISGTSLFLIKTRGTPLITDRAMAAAAAARDVAPAHAGAAVTVATPVSQFNPSDKNDVSFRLHRTAWQGYTLTEASNSNVAVHYRMNRGDDKRFLKVYYIFTQPNAAREANFYERYKERGDDLFLRPPDDVLIEPDGVAPWAMVFPRLTPLDEGPRPGAAEAAAIGYGVAKLLQTLAEDRLINYDLDSSMLCVDDAGRLVVVDFDNTYPMLDQGQGDRSALMGILTTGELPCKNPWLPPEARAFLAKGDSAEREEAITKIGAAFGTYMLAVMLLQVLQKAEESTETDGTYVTFQKNAIASLADANDEDVEAGRDFEALLRMMLRADPERRPSPAEVTERFNRICRKFSAGSPAAAGSIARLIGGVANAA